MCKKSSLYRILGEDWSSEKKEEKKILVAEIVFLVNFYERFYADEIVFPEIEKSLSFRRSKALDGKMSLY